MLDKFVSKQSTVGLSVFIDDLVQEPLDSFMMDHKKHPFTKIAVDALGRRHYCCPYPGLEEGRNYHYEGVVAERQRMETRVPVEIFYKK